VGRRLSWEMCAPSRFVLVLVLLGFSVLHSGCANPYTMNYHDMTSGKRVSEIPDVIPNSGAPRVLRGTDFHADDVGYLEDGYVPIGYSDFYGDEADEGAALEQAKKLNAAFVVLYDHRVDDSSEFGAKYWVKTKPRILGAICVALPGTRKSEVPHESGVLVFAVVRDSPASRAAIRRGDVITRIGTDEVPDVPSYKRLIDRYAGQEVSIEFVREGQAHERSVTLLPRPY